MQLWKFKPYSYCAKEKITNFFNHLEQLKSKCEKNERIDVNISFCYLNNCLEYKNEINFCDKFILKEKNNFQDLSLQLKNSTKTKKDTSHIVSGAKLLRFAVNDNYLLHDSRRNIGIFELEEDGDIIVIKIEMEIKNIFDKWFNEVNKIRE